MAYLDINGIKQAFAEHMKKYRGYSDEEAAIAVSDFPNPYSNCYLDEDYLEDSEIDGVEYEKNASYTTFWRMGIDDVPMFRFYTYYCNDDIPNHQVGEYMNARKFYQIDELDPDDFPEDTVKRNSHSLDFDVTLCLGGGDGGDVCVSIDVSDEEYELLMDCRREDDEIDGYPGLEDLSERIKDAAKDENDCCMMDIDSEGNINYEDVSFIIYMPNEITDKVDEEDKEGSIEWGDYCGYPFAMEVVNGEIISMTIDFQEKVKQRILDELRVTDEELIAYLSNLADGKELCDERFELIRDCEYNAISEILGFNSDEKLFSPEGIGFLDSSHGWEAKRLLENLGFSLSKDIDYGPHGHGTNGVVYIFEQEAK